MKDSIATESLTAEGHVECRYYKAQGVGGRAIESVALIFEHEFPEIEGDNWAKHARDIHEGDAVLLERRLFETMPGGTYDALLRAMLLRRASLFRVPS